MSEFTKLQRKQVGRSNHSSHTPTIFPTTDFSPTTSHLSQTPAISHNFAQVSVLPKLEVSQPDDPAEQEADRVAEQIMRMPEPINTGQMVMRSLGETIHRKCDACEQEEDLMRKANGGMGEGAIDQVYRAVQSGGQPLDAATRSFMEPRFGHDFSQVRIHADSQAADSARGINARAYTLGQNVVFGSGQYAPGTSAGKELLAHELTHVVQQTNAVQTKFNQEQPNVQRSAQISLLPEISQQGGRLGEDIVSREEDPSASQDQTQASPDDEQIMVVQEEFEPDDSGIVPDQDWYIPTVNSDDNLDQQAESSNLVAAPSVGFTDGGRIGTTRYGDSLVANNDSRPHAFADRGQTGTVVWAGGGGAGAHGSENAGSVQVQIAPVYESRSNGIFSNSEAWVRPGTGNIDVIRSWVGINAGDQGNGHFVTAAAAARINQHETQHVANTQMHYNTHIVPLLARVTVHTGSATGSSATAYTQSGAIDALKNMIRWAESVTAFQTADTNDNRPGGTIDANDKASGTYPVDAGPGTVGGVTFHHRVRLPSEPNPV